MLMRTSALKGCFTVCQRTDHAFKCDFSTLKTKKPGNPMRGDPIARAGHNARPPNAKPHLPTNFDV